MIAPGRDRACFAATDQGIWRSDDGGQTLGREDRRACPGRRSRVSPAARTGHRRWSCSTAPSAARTRTACFEGASTARATAARPGNRRWAAGLNTDTKQADQWAYGPIAQYHQLLATDAKPLTVYALNTSTGFHPPHSDTVYRSDDGGETWRATYFQDPRFQRLQRRARLGNRLLRQVLQGRRNAVRRGHLQHAIPTA